jgi:adenylate cyclase
MADDVRNLAVLFADVSGSTYLYETLGDADALATIGRCLALVRYACEGHGGRVIKTIGDEMMVVFPEADLAAAAAADMQGLVSAQPPVGRIRLAIRVGVNFGPAIVVENDVFGDSVNVAARMVGLARGNQIMLSAQTVAALTPSPETRLRHIDLMTLKGKHDDVAVYELLWQESEAELTRFRAKPVTLVPHVRIRHESLEFELDEARSSCTLGRDPENDVVVTDPMASRLHARIERRRDKFVVIDQSTNGTFVTIEGEAEVHLRREELMLRGRGQISFGHARGEDVRAKDDGEIVQFVIHY